MTEERRDRIITLDDDDEEALQAELTAVLAPEAVLPAPPPKPPKTATKAAQTAKQQIAGHAVAGKVLTLYTQDGAPVAEIVGLQVHSHRQTFDTTSHNDTDQYIVGVGQKQIELDVLVRPDQQAALLAEFKKVYGW